MMDKQELITAMERELEHAIARGLSRERIEHIRSELANLGVKPPVESAGTGSATKRVRKTAS